MSWTLTFNLHVEETTCAL